MSSLCCCWRRPVVAEDSNGGEIKAEAATDDVGQVEVVRAAEAGSTSAEVAADADDAANSMRASCSSDRPSIVVSCSEDEAADGADDAGADFTGADKPCTDTVGAVEAGADEDEELNDAEEGIYFIPYNESDAGPVDDKVTKVGSVRGEVMKKLHAERAELLEARDAIARHMVSLINATRSQHGCRPLELSNDLSLRARCCWDDAAETYSYAFLTNGVYHPPANEVHATRTFRQSSFGALSYWTHRFHVPCLAEAVVHFWTSGGSGRENVQCSGGQHEDDFPSARQSDIYTEFRGEEFEELRGHFLPQLVDKGTKAMGVHLDMIRSNQAASYNCAFIVAVFNSVSNPIGRDPSLVPVAENRPGGRRPYLKNRKK